MNRVIRIWTGMALFSILAASSLQAAEQAPNLLEPAALNQMIQQGEKFTLINSMSVLECRDRSIPDSLCIPDEEFAAKAPKLLPDKTRPLVFYCESNRCSRSGEAASMAVKEGYQRVSVLNGGIPAWKKAGYGTVSQERIPRVPVESVKPELLGQFIIENRGSFYSGRPPGGELREGPPPRGDQHPSLPALRAVPGDTSEPTGPRR